MRTVFDEQLKTLNRELIAMGGLCEEAIALSAKAVLNGDLDAASRVAGIEEDIDQKEREIESLCLKMLLKQQPVASDLRRISAALKMITDMERIGDQARDIAEIITSLKGKPERGCEDIGEMARETIKMVTDSVDAYVNHDLELATSVIKHDDIVDELFNRLKSSIVLDIAANPNDGEYDIDVLMISKYFERIGDHAANIAEWVVFGVTGDHKGEHEL